MVSVARRAQRPCSARLLSVECRSGAVLLPDVGFRRLVRLTVSACCRWPSDCRPQRPDPFAVLMRLVAGWVRKTIKAWLTVEHATAERG